MSLKTYNIILAICAISVMLALIPIAYYNFTLGSDESDYEIVCVYGHEYYRANFMTKIALGIKLDVNGKPIKCKGD